MRRRTKTALGVDLGERHVGVALVQRGPQGFRTLAAAREELPAAEQGQFPGKVLSRLLAQLGRRARLRDTRVAVAVSSEPLVVRLLDLPKHVPTNIGTFVANELQQYVALSGKTIVSDFCGVGAGAQKRLLAAAADGDRIREMVKACAAAGIVVDLVEPALLAHARAFLEKAHRVDLLGLVAHFLLQRLQDDVGDIKPRHKVAVRLSPHEFSPPKCAASADLVINQHFLPQDPFEVRLLQARHPVGLSARIKTNHVVYLPGWIGRLLWLSPRPLRANPQARDHGQHDPSNDFSLHDYFLLLKSIAFG